MQRPDTCRLDGRTWAVEQWDGNYASIPTNEQLGIETKSDSTANWSGRIDHFVVHRDKLFLLKIEVNLAEGFIGTLPANANREVLCRYENMWTIDKDGERPNVREYRFEFFVFHKLFVPYTGDLLLTYPCVDLWEQPITDDDDNEEATESLCLSFRRGILIGSWKCGPMPPYLFKSSMGSFPLG
jgi:hypothetical protein